MVVESLFGSPVYSISLSLSLSSSFSLCLSVAGWWVFCRAQDTGDTKYADITQTTHRGQVVLHGVVKTLATSTRLYDLKTVTYVKPERHLAILGYGPA